jgi:hypothetical protein
LLLDRDGAVLVDEDGFLVDMVALLAKRIVLMDNVE